VAPVKLLTNKELRAFEIGNGDRTGYDGTVRLLLDYRPALTTRTGAGEWIHQMALALLNAGRTHPAVDVTLFSSSWKDRPSRASVAELSGARWIDRRVPVRVLNFTWHRLEWPPVELLAGASFDLVQSPHPLLLPSRSAAQAVTIHDLDFLRRPDEARGEIRRDYPALVHQHARRADLIIVPSQYTAGEVSRTLGVAPERVFVCRPGAPGWARPLGDDRPAARDGYVLFLGALGARKNIGRLLDAYAMLRSRRPDVPKLVLAGKQPDPQADWLAALYRPPLAGHVEMPGYIPDDRRPRLYAGARILVIPSLEEGFGLPALEAMALGIPVVASARGSLPEVLGGAGVLMNPEDVSEMAAAIERALYEPGLAAAMTRRGLDRAKTYSWENSVSELIGRYRDAIARRNVRHPHNP
jgi:glycosyltransferase involved in cell wall biosynthesis